MKFEFYAETENGEHFYKIVVEESMNELVRMNISCISKESDSEHNSQGVDLTQRECAALGKYLLEIASK